MLERLFGSHAKNLGQAMNRTSQRHGVLAENLANVNTAGYKRKDVDFSIVLDGQKPGLESTRTRITGVQETEASVRIDGNSVDLEREVYAIAETQLRYQLLADMTGRYFRGLKDVIREGR